MTRFENISIRSKLTVLISFAIIPLLIGQIIYTISSEIKTLENDMKESISTVARLTGNYCITDIIFNDQSAAEISLEKLNNIPSIHKAVVFNSKGIKFAEFKSQEQNELPNLIHTQAPFSNFQNQYLIINEPIYYKNEIIGSIVIAASTKSLNDQIDAQSLRTLLVMLILVIITIIVARIFQKSIVAPIIQLVEITQQVANTGDYQLRGKKHGNDEIGKLVDSFNHLLEKVEATTVSKNFVDSIIDSMQESLIILDKEGNIKQVNQYTVNLTKYSSKELLKMSLTDLVKDPMPFNTNSNFHETSIKCKNNNYIPISFSYNTLDKDSIVCVAHDLSSQKEYENQIKASLQEKEVMIKEIHHRVKNNLQVISSLLKLQFGQINNPEIQELFIKSQDRIRSMALIHTKLYQSTDLANIDFTDYIRTLSNEIVNAYQGKKDIKIEIDSTIHSFNIDTIVPLGLMLNEFITNSVKYAFTDQQEGTISVHIAKYDEIYYQMTIKDNGKGLPENFDWKNQETLGMQLIQMLGEQLEGNIELGNTEKGTCFIITFKDIAK